jgi:hypothetical protein
MPSPTGPAWLVWLETTWLAEGLRREPLLFPLVEVLHILGFVVLVGATVVFDLRLLGLSRRLPVMELARHLLPWARGSLAVVAPTGVLLLLPQATHLGTSPLLGLKLTLLGLAGLNAAISDVEHRCPYPFACAGLRRRFAPAVDGRHHLRPTAGLSLKERQPSPLKSVVAFPPADHAPCPALSLFLWTPLPPVLCLLPPRGGRAAGRRSADALALQCLRAPGGGLPLEDAAPGPPGPGPSGSSGDA